jgi:transposase
MKELIEIELELEKLEARKIQLKNQMTRRYIADMFEISTAHCERIFRGEARKEIIKK